VRAGAENMVADAINAGYRRGPSSSCYWQTATPCPRARDHLARGLRGAAVILQGDL